MHYVSTKIYAAFISRGRYQDSQAASIRMLLSCEKSEISLEYVHINYFETPLQMKIIFRNSNSGFFAPMI